MKQLPALLCLLFSCTIAAAQDIKTAEGFYKLKQYDKAKTAIDLAVTGAEKNEPKVWLWKHKIYQAMGTDTKNAAAGAILLAGFEALKKGMAMPKADEAELLVLGAPLNANIAYNEYYASFISAGSAQMNAGNNSGALDNFKNAITVSTLFYDQKMISIALDTMINFYAGYTAMQAGKINEAVYYFKKLCDAGAYGTDLNIAYGWLCNYYLNDKKDIVMAELYSKKGLQIYPADEYLNSKKMDIERAKGNMEGLFKNFEDIIAGGKATFSDYLGYGAELYDHLYVDSKPVPNKVAKQKRLFEVLNKAYELKPASAEVNYILGMSHTSKALELSDEITKNNTPATAAQKEKLVAERMLHATKSTSFLENATAAYEKKTPMSAADKEHYKTALQQLVNLYRFTANQTKLAATEAKLKGL